MLHVVEECKLSEISAVVRRFCSGVTNYVADCYTINLGTLISGNILLSSLVYAMPPEREKVSVGWSETVY